MKRFFYAIFELLILSPLLSATEFTRVDSILTESTQVMIRTAEKKETWSAEKSHLLALVASYEAILKSKQDTLKKLQSENSKIESTTKSISEKIAKDELAIAEISKSLDSFFADLQKNKIAKKILEENAFGFENFTSKNIVEKLSFLTKAYSKLLEADTTVENNQTNISTGKFITASGKADGDIAILKVKGVRK